jgi:hypothetical protein
MGTLLLVLALSPTSSQSGGRGQKSAYDDRNKQGQACRQGQALLDPLLCASGRPDRLSDLINMTDGFDAGGARGVAFG